MKNLFTALLFGISLASSHAFADCSKLKLSGNWIVENAGFQNNDISVFFDSNGTDWREADSQKLSSYADTKTLTIAQNTNLNRKFCILERTPSIAFTRIQELTFGRVTARFSKLIVTSQDIIQIASCADATCNDVDYSESRKMKRILK
jgi:hypothetical protein